MYFLIRSVYVREASLCLLVILEYDGQAIGYSGVIKEAARICIKDELT